MGGASVRSAVAWVLVCALITLSAAVLVGGFLLESRTEDPFAATDAPTTAFPTLPASTPSAARTPTPQPGPTPHPAFRRGGTWIAVDGAIVAAGGVAPEGRLIDGVARFDGSAWTDLPALPEHRTDAGGAALDDGTLLVLGGTRDGDPTDSTFILAPGATAWTEGPPMPDAQAAMGVATVAGRVFLVGGSAPGHERDLLVFDPAAGTWTRGAPAPAPMTDAMAAAVDGRIYLFDPGETATDAYRYDPAVDRWETLAPLPAPVEPAAAVVVEARIWLTSPFFTPDPVGASRFAVYDPGAERWLATPAGQFGSFGARGALVLPDGRILLLGSGVARVIQTDDAELTEL